MYRKLLSVALALLVLSLAGAAYADLVARWEFEGNTADSSGNGLDGTLMGDAHIAAGLFGGALNLDGDGDYMVVEGYKGIVADRTDPDNPFQKPFTVALWINYRGDGSLINWGSSDGTGVGGQYQNFRIHGGRLRAEHGNGRFRGATLVNDGEWHHVVMAVAEGANIQVPATQMYVDGEPDPQGADTVNDQNIWNLTEDSDVAIGTRASHIDRFFNGMIDDARIYNHQVTQEEVQAMMQAYAELASDPNPASGASDLNRDVVLSWTAGSTAVANNVYLGASADDLALVSEGQAETTLDVGRLEFGTTNYWRVDGVDADGAVIEGFVWAFTIEPLSRPIENVTATASSSDLNSDPNAAANGSGLDAEGLHNTEAADQWLSAADGPVPAWIQFEFDRVYKMHDMLVWNSNTGFEAFLGYGFKDVTVEVSENGTDWTPVTDVEFAQAPGAEGYAANTLVELGGVAAKYVKLTANTNWGGLFPQSGLSEVAFSYVPAHARELAPADGAADLGVDTVLSWRAGREAAVHEVYLDTSEGAVADGTALVDTITETTYAPELDYAATYYWKINEVNEAEAVSVWEGDVVNFTTTDYANIDGLANQTLEYDNSMEPFLSEIAVVYDPATDLTAHAAETMKVNFQGNPNAFAEAEGVITMSAAGADIWGTADQFRYAYKSLSGDGAMVARVDSIDNIVNTWCKAGVMIRQSTDPGSAHMMMVMTGSSGNGASAQGRPEADAASVNSDSPEPIAPPYYVKVERVGDDFTMSVSADSEAWVQIGDARTVAMTDPVLIGLCLTSHDAGSSVIAQFSEISTSGDVTGDMTVEAIGVAMPSNDPAGLYVTVEDSAGQVATVVNPDPEATLAVGMTEWVIPLSDLAGADLTSVVSLAIGVGDPANPVAGGAGTVTLGAVSIGRDFPLPNILANGGFEDGVLDPWRTYGDASIEVVSELVGAAVPDGPIEGAMCLHVTVGSAGVNFWDAGLQHAGHIFEAGKSYTLSAYLKAKEGTMDINFKPELGASPWTGYGSQAFTMTDEWQEFSVSTGVIPDVVDPATITFHIAYAAGEFWVDGVRFYEEE